MLAVTFQTLKALALALGSTLINFSHRGFVDLYRAHRSSFQSANYNQQCIFFNNLQWKWKFAFAVTFTVDNSQSVQAELLPLTLTVTIWPLQP